MKRAAVRAPQDIARRSYSVTWDQNARRGEICSATTLSIALCFLHMHRVSLGNRTADVIAISARPYGMRATLKYGTFF